MFVEICKFLFNFAHANVIADLYLVEALRSEYISKMKYTLFIYI